MCTEIYLLCIKQYMRMNLCWIHEMDATSHSMWFTKHQNCIYRVTLLVILLFTVFTFNPHTLITFCNVKVDWGHI